MHTPTNTRMKLVSGTLLAATLLTAACGGGKEDATPKVAAETTSTTTTTTAQKIVQSAPKAEPKTACSLATKDELATALGTAIARTEEQGMSEGTTPGGYGIRTACQSYDSRDRWVGTFTVQKTFPHYSAYKGEFGDDHPVSGVGDEAFCARTASDMTELWSLKGQYGLTISVQGHDCDDAVTRLGQVAIARLS